MDFKVRPFDEKRVGGDQGIEGKIERGTYVLLVNGFDYQVETSEVGTDALGPFALIPEGQKNLGVGVFLRVEVDIDEEKTLLQLDQGCSITLVEPQPEEQVDAVLRSLGLPPNSVNVLAVARFAFAVVFDAGGTPHSWDCVRLAAAEGNRAVN